MALDENISSSSILTTKFYCISPSFILFSSTNIYGPFAVYCSFPWMRFARLRMLVSWHFLLNVMTLSFSFQVFCVIIPETRVPPKPLQTVLVHSQEHSWNKRRGRRGFAVQGGRLSATPVLFSAGTRTLNGTNLFPWPPPVFLSGLYKSWCEMKNHQRLHMGNLLVLGFVTRFSSCARRWWRLPRP